MQTFVSRVSITHAAASIVARVNVQVQYTIHDNKKTINPLKKKKKKLDEINFQYKKMINFNFTNELAAIIRESYSRVFFCVGSQLLPNYLWIHTITYTQQVPWKEWKERHQYIICYFWKQTITQVYYNESPSSQARVLLVTIYISLYIFIIIHILFFLIYLFK